MAKLLREMIEDDRDTMFDLTNKELFLYYNDHKEEILARCETKYLTADDMAKYEHRPQRYLFENNYPKESYWLFCWVNDLSGAEEFKDLTSVRVPNYSQIEDLYSTFRTIQSQRKSAEEYLNEK